MADYLVLIQVASVVVVAGVIGYFGYAALDNYRRAERYEALFRGERSQRYRLETDLFVTKATLNGKVHGAKLSVEAALRLLDDDKSTELDEKLVRIRLVEALEALARRPS